MSLAFNEAMFIQFLKQESAKALNIRKAVSRIGKQPHEDIYVFGEGIHIDSEGVLIPQDAQEYIWLDWSVQQHLGTVTMKEVLPRVTVPLNTYSLHRAVQLLRAIMKHNFIPSLLVVAGGVLALHYSTIIESSGCPVIVANGPAQTGKTTAIKVALSLMGMLFRLKC